MLTLNWPQTFDWTYNMVERWKLSWATQRLWVFRGLFVFFFLPVSSSAAKVHVPGAGERVGNVFKMGFGAPAADQIYGRWSCHGVVVMACAVTKDGYHFKDFHSGSTTTVVPLQSTNTSANRIKLKTHHRLLELQLHLATNLVYLSIFQKKIQFISFIINTQKELTNIVRSY